MIELSKCPTCASEDRVTIAGKDFCMRCGTPSADAASSQNNIPVPNAVTTTQEAVAAPEGVDQPTTQIVSNVAKFTQATPSVQDTPLAEAANNSAEPQPVAPLANTSSEATPAQPPLQNNTFATQQPPSDQAMGATTNVSSLPVASQAEQSPASIQPPAQPLATNTSPNPPQNYQQPAVAPPEQTNQMQPATATPQPDASMMGQPQVNANPAETPNPAGAPGVPFSTPEPPAPEPINLNSTEALTQPIEASPPAVEEQARQQEPASSSPTITTHSMPMNLNNSEHEDTGVFSDAQLEALSKSTAAPIDLDRPDKNETSKASLSLDSIKPAAPQPTNLNSSQLSVKPEEQSSQTAISKVADTEAKLPKEKAKSKKVLKPAGIGLSIVALFLVGAYIWQLNYPTLAFKIASSKAGMNASMPGYMPGGYKLAGEIQTNPGAVSYNLVNQSEGKKILISQTKTDWDSQALAENYVAAKAENYLALQAQGLTIYMLGDSQATWVNKGTWYKIESVDQSLSQDQAIKIATSL